MDFLTLTIEVLRAVLLAGGGVLWATAVGPRGRDPRQRWRVRLASACLAAMIAGSVLLGVDTFGVVVLALGLAGLLIAADDDGLAQLETNPWRVEHG